VIHCTFFTLFNFHYFLLNKRTSWVFLNYHTILQLLLLFGAAIISPSITTYDLDVSSLPTCYFIVTPLLSHCTILLFLLLSAYTELTHDSQHSLLCVFIYIHICTMLLLLVFYTKLRTIFWRISEIFCIGSAILEASYQFWAAFTFGSLWNNGTIQKGGEGHAGQRTWMSPCTQLLWQCLLYSFYVPIWYLNENNVTTPQIIEFLWRTALSTVLIPIAIKSIYPCIVNGIIFLSTWILQHLSPHFSSKHQFGCEAPSWYWPYVDTLWFFCSF
jgi:hypothetical protein